MSQALTVQPAHLDVRVLPHDLQAERAVLGAVQLEPSLFDVAEASGLRAAHFFRDAHVRIWQAYTRIRVANAPIDFITLRSDLDRHGDLEQVGGPAYLAGLVDGIPRAVNVEGYARIVRDKALLRDLIAQANRTIAQAYEEDDVATVIDGAEQRLQAIGRDHARGDFVPAAGWMNEVWGSIAKLAEDPRDVTGVPSGIQGLDRLTRGWQPANLIVIAGRPGDGKTALMLQCVDAATKHTHAAVVSLEMSKQELGFRWVSITAQIDSFRMQTGRLHPHEMRRVGDAIQDLAERNVSIDDKGGQSIAEVCAKIRRLHGQRPVGIVFIDYLQLLSASGAENKTLELEQISGRLLALAKDLQIPVVVLSQLTRDSVKQGPNTRPQLHNLRGSGAIEQDAHVVLFVHRPNKREDDDHFTDGEETELLLAKQRNGPTNKIIKTIWHASMTKFADRVEAGAAQPGLL